MGYKFDASGLLRGLVETELKTKAALGLYADTVSKKMENHAKSNYAWNDQTFQASRRLKGSWKWQGNVARIEIGHGVDYGIYLEFCNEKRYAIISRTVDKVSPSAIKGLQNLMK
ncbi:MAG: hypothetical protein ACRCX8_13830 [Sarcina sp.]